MTLTTILLLAVGVPVAAWLVAIAVEFALRKADEFDWHFVDRRLLWTFVLLDQLFVTVLSWRSHDRWMWLALLCTLASAAMLVKEIAARPLRRSNG